MASLQLYLSLADALSPTKPGYLLMEFWAGAVALVAAAAAVVPKPQIRLALLGGSIGALLALGYWALTSIFGSAADPNYYRPVWLAYGTFALIAGALSLSWWESGLTVRQILGTAGAGLVVGGIMAYAAFAAFLIIGLLIHPLTF